MHTLQGDKEHSTNPVSTSYRLSLEDSLASDRKKIERHFDYSKAFDSVVCDQNQ